MRFLAGSSDDEESSEGKPTDSHCKRVRFDPMTSHSVVDEQSVGSDTCSTTTDEESSEESESEPPCVVAEIMQML